MDSTLFSVTEQNLLERFNATTDPTTLGYCLHDLVQQATATYEDKLAIISAEQSLTYRELNNLANHYARVLGQRGIRRGDLIAVVLGRSVKLVVMLLASLKVGAAYVPIDPAFPQDRVQHMLEDAEPKLIIVESVTEATISFWEGHSLNVEALGNVLSDLPADLSNLDIDVRPDDLAYVIYTSGSTGLPKGVEISHGALCNLLLGMKREPGCNETDRLLAVTTISFDIAVLEIFLPLICGATTVMTRVEETRDPRALLRLIQHHSITIMQATPAAWQMLIDAGWNDDVRLSKIICGGEALARQLAERLLSHADSVWNVYGPTEATVWATIWQVCPDHSVVIGRPINNYRIYVLDDELSPVPIGVEGELYIGGASLAKGYHKKPDLTQSRFIDNPFHEGRMYRTGDLACFDAPGNLRVLGRTDDQVKIRGFRIELGDIEAAITDHDSIAAAVVVAREGRLVAFCIRNQSVQANGPQWSVPKIEHVLRPWLSSRLPLYMLPAFFVELETFPMTPNRKIDRKALPDPSQATESTSVNLESPTALEWSIQLVWSKVLGHNHIGMDDNFFEIGGDSTRVIKMQAELEQLLARPLTPAIFFEHYTIKSLAKFLHGTKEAVPEPDLFQRRVSDQEGIAIVSMACRLPGGVTNPSEYWELLESGADVITSVPKDRWDTEAIYDADPNANGKSYCRQGGFIDSVDDFDAPFFGISPREARAMDPSQRIGLETCWEGLERAGYTTGQLRGSNTGVFMGVCTVSAHAPSVPSLEELDGYTITGTAGSTMSGRVSYVFGLEGPSMTVDTACSSSLVTTHLACNALRQGECDLAVAGGISLLLSPAMHVEFSRLNGMSVDGRCRAFAADSTGTGWAEGCTVVVLKRLSDAIRDNDRIHALVRGTAVNHGGRSAAGLTVPSGQAQQRLVRTALAASQLTPDQIDYVEAHGTGTKLGDPIEGAALAGVFGSSRPNDADPLWIGSAKSNLGHTQAAAGLAGVIKVVLAMENNKLPQTLHVSEPSPAVDWEGSHMALVQEPQPWYSTINRPRRAGISAFGISGTNSHVIVEDPPSIISQEVERDVKAKTTSHLPLSSQDVAVPFLLSGRTHAALLQQVERLESFIQSAGKTDHNCLLDIAFSLATTRTMFEERHVLWAKDKASLIEGLTSISQGLRTGPLLRRSNPQLAMLFTGQGSQACGMGKDLYHAYPVFRIALDEIAKHFFDLEIPLIEVMHSSSGSETGALLQRTDYAQPALFALEVALWHLWTSWGVNPDVILGHSVGELAVAHVSGVLSLPDACRLVAARGQLMQAVPIHGRMVSLEASAEEVGMAIESLGVSGQAEIAGHNTPLQTIASGDADAVMQLASVFANRGRKTKILDVSHAFHSHHMDSILSDFRSVAQTMTFMKPKLPIISTLTGKLSEPGQLETPEYWVQQVRQAVRFTAAIQTTYQRGVSVFLELGPRPVLSGMGATCLEDQATVAWMPSLVHGRDDVSIIQRSLADLHARHVNIDWDGYLEPFGPFQRVELPTYPFQRERYPSLRKTDLYKENTSQKQRRDSADIYDGHDTAVRSSALEICWQETANSPTSSTSSSTWGVLRQPQNMTSPSQINAILEQAGIKALWIEDSEDLGKCGDLDGLLCFWEPTGEIDQVNGLTTQALTQLQSVINLHSAPPLVWITRNTIGTCSSDPEFVAIASAPLLGLMRTARNEHPELNLRLIDLDNTLEMIPPGFLSALELHNVPECAIRQGRVLVPQLQYAPALDTESTEKKQLLRSDGAVIITGGLGDLGRRVAMWLATTHGVRDLVLISRQGMDTPGADDFVKELAKSGSEISVVACDIAEFQNLEEVMSMFSKTRPLRGVVHTAGLLDDGALQDLTPERFARVFAPKVKGAWNLHQLTQGMDMDLFLLFSSVSGIIGTPGQANYAAANTFLDALAQLRHAQCLPASSMCYGPWGGAGMAGRLSGANLGRWTRMGFGLLEPNEGLELTAKAIYSGRALTMVAALDPRPLHAFLSEKDEGVLSLCKSLMDQRGNKVQPHKSNVNPRDLREVLRCSVPEAHHEVVLNMVRATVAQALGFARPNEVDPDQPLQDVGIDSLTAVLVRNQLVKLTNLKLSARFAFQYPNLRTLSQFLVVSLQEDMAHLDESNDSGTSTPPTSVGSQSMATTIDIATIKKGHLEAAMSFRSTQDTKSPGAVLVTGATGFVGAFIAGKLLQLGISVYCLVRAESTQKARQRLLDTLIGQQLWKSDYEPLLHAVVGDLSQPLLGLSEDLFEDLADNIDSICHSGGLVDWVRPLEDYLGPNIVSTHEILRLASQGREKTVHFISTMSTLPKYMGLELVEGEGEYGYATSKYMAERMVAAARWRGAKASVYRLPFVTASASSGCFRLERGDFMHSLISGCLEMGSFPSLDADLAAVLPVDYLANTIVTMMTSDMSRIGKDYDFANSNPLSFNEFWELLSAASTQQQIVDFVTWRERAFDYVATHPQSPLARIISLIDDVSDAKSAAAFVTGPMVGRDVLGGEDYPVSVMDQQAAQNYVACIDALQKSVGPQ
jgi:amino acid adenylation domain-containing protein/thioester reductase-like protein